MEILDQEERTCHLTCLREMRGRSSSLSSIRHQNKSTFSQKWRQQTPCGSSSTLFAPSLVPTSSEVGLGSHIRDGGQNRRIGILKRRIEAALDGMELLLRRRPKEPDGDEELERRRTRSIEFLSRFSRNYLFQLRIQVMELKRQMQCSSFASPGRHTRHQVLLKRVVAAYQTAVQGLQACLNQLPGSLHDSAILSKLDQLLCYLCELTSLKSQIDVHACLAGSDPPQEDSMKTKALNLVDIVRKKRMDREDSCGAWRKTAAVLARKRFGLPLNQKAKIANQQERKSVSKADRRGKTQRQGKKLRTTTDLQGGNNGLPKGLPVGRVPLHPSIDSNQPQPQPNVSGMADAPIDPETALELRIIMSRMKDILRGAHAKPSSASKPTYPPNVRLVCITHEEEAPEEEKDILGRPLQSDEVQSETQFETQSEKQLENRLQDRPDSQNILRSKISSLSAEEPETPSPLTTFTARRRRFTSEEQRIIKYRNRFKSYKERVRDVQRTSEQILSTVFREVANELEPSILLDKMYHLELQG